MTELKEAGVPDKQAAIHAEKLAEFMENTLATKEDLKNTEQRLSTEIMLVKEDLKNTEQKLSTEITHVREDLKNTEAKFELALKNTEQRFDLALKNTEQKLGADIVLVEQKLGARIDKVESKLDWLIRLMGVIAFVFAVINFVHSYFPGLHF